MNKNLEQLIQLSNFDKNIDGFSPKIAAIQKELNDKQNEIAEVQKEVENSNKEIKDLADEIEKTDNHIKDLNSQLKAGSKKHSAIKTERELKDYGIEIEYVDLEENPKLRGEYSVFSFPTLLLLKNGKEIDRVSGFFEFSKMKRVLES